MSHAKKSFGQHFLRDHSVIEKILARADIQSGDVVVEAGPGQGALTLGLAEKTDTLVLIEADRDLLPELKEQFPKAEMISGDAALVDYDALLHGRKPWIFVSNLPYNAGNAILMQVVRSKNTPKNIVIMVQKEVGERMLGLTPGILSVAVSLYAHVERVCTVKPGAFVPPPKVDSVVLKMTPLASVVDREGVIALAKDGFMNRRKQLHRNLEDVGRISSEKTKEILKNLGYSPLARAEELKTADWIRFFEIVKG